MRVEVLLFAVVRQRAGTDRLELELDDGATAGDALRALAMRDGLEELSGRLPVRVAINREYAPEDSVLSAGDELAVIPPVIGGAGPHASGGTGLAPSDVTPEATRAVIEREGRRDPGAGADRQLPGQPAEHRPDGGRARAGAHSRARPAR